MNFKKIERKTYLILFLFLNTLCYSQDSMNNTYNIEMTNVITAKYFEQIKQFILENGDRTVYCSKYNNSPHYKLLDFDIYLNPSIGQRNVNNDINISGYNELVIQISPPSEPTKYFTLISVTEADYNDNQVLNIMDDMTVENVYWVDLYGDFSNESRELLIQTISSIKDQTIH